MASDYQLVVKKSNIRGGGMGLFADEDIPKGSIIGEYEGDKYPPDYTFTDAEYIYTFGTDKMIIKPYDTCILRFANDIINVPASKREKQLFRITGFARNLDWEIQEYDFEEGFDQESVFMITKKDVKKGDELYIEYGSGYWEYFLGI